MVEGAEVTDASWLSQDAGREKRVPIEYAYAGGGSAHVGHLAALDASNAREPLVFTLQCKQQARYAGFVGDAVTVSLPEIGLSSTKMVVVSRIVNPDGTVDYELLVETDAKYAFSAGKTSVAPSFTLQPGFNIYSVPQPDLADWTAVAAQITSGSTSLPIVRVTGSAANYNFASNVVFKIRLNSVGSPWLVSEDAPPAATQHEFRGLTNNTGYIVGIAYRGVTGLEGPVRELAAVTTGTFVAGAADVGLGVNQAVNSDFNQGTVGHFYSAFDNLTGTGLTRQSFRNLNIASNKYFGARNVLAARVSVTSGSLSGSFFWGWAQNGFFGGSDNFRFATRVKPNDRVYAAASLSVHGATGGGLVIRFFDAAGALVVGGQLTTEQVIGDSRLGGPNGLDGLPANYARVGNFFVAPANAAFATICPYAYNVQPGQSDVYIFQCDYQTCVVLAGQTVPPPYAPGPSDLAADRTGENTAGGFLGQGNQATTNIYRQATAPSSPNEGDIWEDTSTTPVSIRRRISGAWVFQGEEGADITAQAVPSVEGPASVSFDVDGAGALSPGSQVPRTLQFIRKRGNTDVSTSTTWSIVSPVNVTLGTITNGGVNITAVAAGLSNFTVRSVRDGVTIDYLVNVAKNTIAAGVISATRKTQDTNAGTPNNGSWNTIASVVLSNCPTGNLYFDSSYMLVATGTGSCSHQARLTVDGVQVGSVQAAQATVTGSVPEAVDFSELFSQVIAVSAGSRTIAFQLQRTLGSGTIDSSATRFDVSAFPT
jgi:hypothetical protein